MAAMGDPVESPELAVMAAQAVRAEREYRKRIVLLRAVTAVPVVMGGMAVAAVVVVAESASRSLPAVMAVGILAYTKLPTICFRPVVGQVRVG